MVKIEEEKKELETKVERLEKEIDELNESSAYLNEEKEENGQVISKLAKKVEEGVKKENDLLMEIEGLVDELVREKKDIEILTQQRNSLDVNLNQVQQEAVNLRLNQVQQEAVNLRHTIETLTRDKIKTGGNKNAT